MISRFEKLATWQEYPKFVGSLVEWLKRPAYDQHGVGSKLTRAILLCPWERHSMALSPAWWSWQAVVNYSHSQAGVIAYPMYQRLHLFSCESE